MTSTILWLLPFIMVGLLLPLNHVDGFRRIAQACHHCRWLSSGDDTEVKLIQPVTRVTRTAAAAPAEPSPRCRYRHTAKKHGTTAAAVAVVVPTMSPTTMPIATKSWRPSPSPTLVAAATAGMSQLDRDWNHWERSMKAYKLIPTLLLYYYIAAKGVKMLFGATKPDCEYKPTVDPKKHSAAFGLWMSIGYMLVCFWPQWTSTKPLGMLRIVWTILSASFGASGKPADWIGIFSIALDQAVWLLMFQYAFSEMCRYGRLVYKELSSDTHYRNTSKELAVWGGVVMIFVVLEIASWK